jgi:transcriptional regulator with XRE-family HTH domain
MNLREWRERQGLTQSELATEFGLTRQRITQIENGQKLPSERTVRRLAKCSEIQALRNPDFLWMLIQNCRGDGAGTRGERRSSGRERKRAKR